MRVSPTIIASKRFNWVLLAVTGIGVVWSIGCQDTNPVAPTPIAVELRIVPATASMTLGQSEEFALERRFSDGRSERIAEVRWVTSNDSVVDIDSHGVARAVGIGIARIVATMSGESAERMLAVVTDFSGKWSGDFHLVSCERLSGAGRNPCFSGAIFPMQLGLTQTQAQLRGTITLGFSTVSSGTVSGVVDGISLSLSGIANDGEGGTAELQNWAAKLTAANVIEGKFDLIRRMSNVVGPQVLLYHCEQMKLEGARPVEGFR